MLAKKCLLIGIVTLLSLSVTISAQPVHPTTGEPLMIDCLRGTVKVDGDLSDWNLEAMTPAVIDSGEQLYSGQENWTGPEDCSGEFYMLWDDVNIYIAVVAKDDVLSMNKADGSIWNADCVEVFFATTEAEAVHSWTNPTIHYQYGFNANNQKWNWCNMDGPGQSEPDYLQIAATKTAEGYICEASIEYGQMLSLDFSAGNTIGFHSSIDDTDIENGDTELFMTWTGLAPHDQSMGYGHMVLSTDTVAAGEPEPVNPGTDNLAAAYVFEADAADSSGNGLDGTLLGNAHVADGVLVLDGDDDAVAIPGIGDGLTEFTLSMMVYPTVDVTPLQFSGGINTDNWTAGVHLKLNYGNINVGVNGLAGGDVVGTSIVEPNKWTHLALTVSPTEVAVYVNGVKEGSRTGETVPAVNVGAAAIGAWNNSGTDIQREMTGMMDDVLIYNRALSEAEIRYLAGERATPVDPGTDGLVAYYPLDIDALDASGNGNDGILNGDPQWVDGKVGGALEMDGGDYVEVPSAADINPESITLMTWVNFSTVDGADMERQDYLSRGDDYAFSLHEWGYRDGTEAEGKISAIVTSAGGWTVLTGTTLVEPETWYHTTLTYDSGTQMLKLYLDGEVEGEMDLPTGLEHRLGGSLTIGTYNGRDLLGKIDDIKIYDRALSAGEIRYLAGFRAMENPDIAAINELYSQATLACSTGDVELYLSIFTEDAVVMAPGYTAFIGKEMLRPAMEGLFGLFDLELPYTVDEIGIPGDWAFVRSRFQYSMTPKEGGETTTNPGEELDILKRQADGSWKIYLECWNYDAPLPAPEVAATSEELGVMKLAQVDDADAMYREMCDLYALAAETGDVDLYVANYTADGVQMPPEAPTRIGSEQIRAAIEPALTLFDIECPIYPKEAVITGDWAFGWCDWSLSLTPKEGGPTTTFNGKGLDVIKRQADGSWKYYIECWNYDGPPIVEE